jgi:F-type H+-transporting ATPase subunit g
MQTYMQSALSTLRQPSALISRLGNTNPNNVLSQVRSMSSAQWMSAGVVAAEVLGFFSVGEIIGRFKLVGYREKEAHH